jgi:hypothetical protein
MVTAAAATDKSVSENNKNLRVLQALLFQAAPVFFAWNRLTRQGSRLIIFTVLYGLRGEDVFSGFVAESSRMVKGCQSEKTGRSHRTGDFAHRCEEQRRRPGVNRESGR